MVVEFIQLNVFYLFFRLLPINNKVYQNVFDVIFLPIILVWLNYFLFQFVKDPVIFCTASIIITFNYLLLLAWITKNEKLLKFLKVGMWKDVTRQVVSIIKLYTSIFTTIIMFFKSIWNYFVNIIKDFVKAFVKGWNTVYDILNSIVTMGGTIKGKVAPPIPIKKIKI